MESEYLRSALTRFIKECPTSPFGHKVNEIPAGMGLTDIEGRTYYALVRMVRPLVIVEAGANRGNSAWYMMKALQANNEEFKIHGVLHTIDKKEFEQEFRADDRGHVFTHFNVDIEKWIDENSELMEKCDIFHHDDSHTTEHIREEIEKVMFYRPKAIAVHDIQTESKEYWDKAKSDESYLSDYLKLECLSLMGVGMFIRNDVLKLL